MFCKNTLNFRIFPQTFHYTLNLKTFINKIIFPGILTKTCHII